MEPDRKIAKDRSRALRLVIVFVLMLLLIETGFRISGAHRFRYWQEYGYGTQQGLLDLPGGRIAMYSSANRRFWPREIDASPKPSQVRFVVLGDSVARGSGPANSYPYFAELALRAAGCPAEVINLSSGGYGSARKEVLARMALQRLSPHVLVYQASITTEYEDALDARRRDEAARSGWSIEDLSYASLWMKERKNDIIFERWLSPQVRAHGREAGAAVAAKMDFSAWRAGMEANSASIARLASEAGVPLVAFPRVSFDRATGQVSDFGTGDISRALVGSDRVFRWNDGIVPGRLETLFADSTHLTRAGNEHVGQELARWIMAQGLCRRG